MRPRLAILALLFAVSGAAALVVETTWLRWFRLLFGATAPAVSATLVAFFAGNALGAALAARRVPRVARPLRLYGALELAAAAWAAAVPLLLRAGGELAGLAYDALDDRPAVLTALRFAIALGATLPTAVALGATLPAIGAAALRSTRALGSQGSALYAANVAGAAVGTALAAFWLPIHLGVAGTYALAIGLSAGAGIGALLLAHAAREAAAADDAPVAKEEPPDRTAESAGAERVPAPLLGLAALSGFGALAAQVLFVQAFAQVLNRSVYAFGAVLVIVLLALAAGAALVAWVEGRALLPTRTALGLALALSSLGLLAFPALLHAATGDLSYVGSGGEWPAYLFDALLTAAGTAGPALLACGLVLPLTFALAGQTHGSDAGRGAAGAALGRLAAANTLGAIAGALSAPFVLLPLLGPWSAFAALALAYALPAVLVRDPSAKGRWTRDVLLAVGWVALLALVSPLDYPPTRLAPGERLLDVETGAAGVVAVVEREGERLIRTDGHYALGGTGERVHEERQGHLPLLLHPSARTVAFVGSATGISAGAALAHPVSEIDLVEIVPAVAELARRHFARANRGIYDDPRARVALDDARNFFAHASDHFDVVVADLFVPWRAGTGSLYTREHFAAVRERLREDGIFCQWLPLYQLAPDDFDTIAATFLDVFPRAGVFRGDFYGRFPIAALVGWKGAPASPEAIAAAARRLGDAGEGDRWVTHPAGLWSLYVGPLSVLAPELADVPRNRDDWPGVEFLAARGHVGGVRGKLEPLVALRWMHWTEALLRAADKGADPLFPDLPADALRAKQGGLALQLAGSLYVAERYDDAARALEAAAELLPASLVREAEPDPTAAEVWFSEE